MLQVDMSASKRESFGKCAMRRLRVSGNTPAVLYGNGKDVIPLQLETTPFVKKLLEISRKNAVVNLSINDDTRHVMMREIQTDPVTDSLVHADFYEIDLDTPTRLIVAVDFVGTAKGVDLGGFLMVHHPKVLLEGLPLDIPDAVSVDISDLAIGDSVSIDDIELPANVKMVTDGAALCVEVTSVRAEKVEEVEEDVPVAGAEVSTGETQES